MNIFNTLPIELLSTILWLSSGPPNLEIYKKKVQIKEEINHYNLIRLQFDKDNIWHLSGCKKYGTDGVYLNRLTDYSKTPELETISYTYSHNDHASDFRIKTLKSYFTNLMDNQNQKFIISSPK